MQTAHAQLELELASHAQLELDLTSQRKCRTKVEPGIKLSAYITAYMTEPLQTFPRKLELYGTHFPQHE